MMNTSPRKRRRRKKERTGRTGAPNQAVLADIVRRVVEAATPDQIILFGSAARGEMGPNSDFDLLVVKRGSFNRDRLTERIYQHLYGAEAAVDIIVATPDEVDRYRETSCMVICPALREGRLVYDAHTGVAG